MKILVIGGGLAGVSAIHGIRGASVDCEIVLVDPKDHLEILWTAYRVPFVDWVRDGSIFPLESFCNDMNVKHIKGVVQKLTSKEAIVNEGGDTTTITFDVALIATGAKTKCPGLGRGLPEGSYKGTREERIQMCKDWGEKLIKHKNVVVVGGGLVGVEFASDLKYYAEKNGNNKDMNVTLVHSGEFLCANEMSEASGEHVKTRLEKLGVKVILNDKVIEQDGKCVLQSKPTEVLEADEVVYMVGFFAANDFVEIEGSKNDKGFLKTDDYLRVEGGEGRVFAYGDCCTTLPNAGNLLMRNKGFLAHNIKAALEGKTDVADMQKASASFHMYICTIGPEDGLVYTSWCATSWFIPPLKNSTMFLFVPKNELGLKL